MPLTNVCVEIFENVGKDFTGRATAAVVGKTFAAVTGIQSGPDITSTALPATYDGGNFQVATCPAGQRCDGVFAYDVATGQAVPIKAPGKVLPVTAGAAITAGQEVEVGANGRAIPVASGRAVGKAWTTQGTAGNDVYVRLYA